MVATARQLAPALTLLAGLFADCVRSQNPIADREEGCQLLARGELREARECFDRAIEGFSRDGQATAAAWTRTWRALAFRGEGRLADALNDLDYAGAVLVDDPTPESQDLLVQLRVVEASCLRALGAFETALEAVRAAADAYVRLGRDNPTRLSAIGIELSACLFELGDYDTAIAELEQFLEQANHDLLRAQLIGTQAACLLRMGLFEDAEQLLSRGLDLLDGHSPGLQSLTPAEASAEKALRNRAAARRALGRFDLATADVLRALELNASRFGDNPNVGLAYTLRERAWIHRDLENFDHALADFEAAGEIWRSLYGEKHYLTALTEMSIARTLQLAGDLHTALQRAKKGLELARGLDHRDEWAWEADVARLTLDSGGDPAEALQLFGAAISRLELTTGRVRGLSIGERQRFLGRLDREEVYEDAFRAALATGDVHRAVDLLERGRGRGLADLLAGRDVDPLQQVLAEALRTDQPDVAARADEITQALATARQAVAEAAFELAAARTRPDLAADALAALEAAVEEAREARDSAARDRAALLRAHLPSGAPRATRDLLAALPANTHLLQYVVTSHGSWLVYGQAGSDELTAQELTWPGGGPVTDAALREEVDSWLASLAAGASAPRGKKPRTKDAAATTTDDPGRRLFHTLVPEGPARALGPDDVAILVPHGPLHRLPFEALVVSRGSAPSHWLHEGPALAYAPSASVALWCLERTNGQEPLAPRVVAIGDASYAPHAPDLAPLPHTRREVEGLRDAMGADLVVALLGDEAREARVRQLAPTATVLHFATHQVLDPDIAGRGSRLALSSPEAASAEDDGFLTLDDLFESWRGVLDRCELVVLSACDTQRSTLGPDALRSQGVLALPWGLHFAGCPRVLATLWKVEDDSTADLMIDFYRRLAKRDEATSRLRAFAEARRAFAKQNPAPHRWAPFVWLGDPR